MLDRVLQYKEISMYYQRNFSYILNKSYITENELTEGRTAKCLVGKIEYACLHALVVQILLNSVTKPKVYHGMLPTLRSGNIMA